MTSLARLVVLVAGVVAVGCAWLPWYAAATATTIPARTLWEPGSAAGEPGSYLTTLALLLWVAGAAAILGAVTGRRAFVVIGGLLGAGIAVTWILSNAVSSSASAVAVEQVRVGAYAALGAGVVALLVAALARDTRAPSLR